MSARDALIAETQAGLMLTEQSLVYGKESLKYLERNLSFADSADRIQELINARIAITIEMDHAKDRILKFNRALTEIGATSSWFQGDSEMNTLGAKLAHIDELVSLPGFKRDVGFAQKSISSFSMRSAVYSIKADQIKESGGIDYSSYLTSALFYARATEMLRDAVINY